MEIPSIGRQNLDKSGRFRSFNELYKIELESKLAIKYHNLYDMPYALCRDCKDRSFLKAPYTSRIAIKLDAMANMPTT